MRRIAQIMLMVVVQIAVIDNCWSQSPAPAASPTLPAAETVEELQAATEELNKQPIPEKDVLLLRELDRIDGEIARAAQQVQKANSFKNHQANFNGIADRITKQSKAIAEFDCQNNSTKLQATLQSYIRAFGDLINFANGLGSWDLFSIAPPIFDQANACTDAKSKFSSTEYVEARNELLANIQKGLSDFLTIQNNLGAAETRYLDALKKRRASVQEKLNASQPAFQIGSNLWLLLLILSTACVLTILGIKLFDPVLQMEWVASGQVIQFVTVMILLSVVLALGLSSILKENTLGTLLGGIAGYVLAQGVGRSAARDVARAASGGAGGLPPPPGPLDLSDRRSRIWGAPPAGPAATTTELGGPPPATTP